MSRNRLVAKVRTNDDYRALARLLDDLDLRHRVAMPNGRTSGHPALFVTLPTGAEVPFTIACTPKGYISIPMRLNRLRKFLRDHGIDC